MKSQINIQFQDGGLADSQVWGLTLREGISELYRADADLVIPESSLTLSSLKNDLLRKRVTLTIEQFYNGGIIRRPLHGVVTRYSVTGAASLHPGWLKQFGKRFTKGVLLHLTLEPEAAALKYVRRTLDYPDTTPLKTVQSVFRRHGISAVIDSKYITAEKYSGGLRFFQRDETDFDFVRRIMARYGISFFFRHETAGQEMLYLSDGNAYPGTCAFEFTGYPADQQNQLAAQAENGVFDFSMISADTAFPIKQFSASVGIGTDAVKGNFLHPLESRTIHAENGDGSSVYLSDRTPADHGNDIDDDTVSASADCAAEAQGRAFRLEQDDWHGTTSLLLPVPGEILKIRSFYRAQPDDPPVTVKILHSELSVTLDDSTDAGVFELSFHCMDYAEDAQDRRFCAKEPEMQRSEAPVIREAIVCDINGKTDDPQTRNTLVQSPRSMPDTPWRFLVRNENADSENPCIDVEMNMPLGGKRSGLYRFPRVGERVLLLEEPDKVVLLGYSPDKTGAFSEFTDGTDTHARNASALRYSAPGKEKDLSGQYDEIGFSRYEQASEAMEQKIVDGTAYAFLMQLAFDENSQEKRADVELNWKPRLLTVRKNYFLSPGNDSALALTALAKEAVSVFELDRNPFCTGNVLRLFTQGSILQYSKQGIDIKTDGTLNISAAAVNINGSRMVNLQSEGVVRSVSGASSVTVNQNGIMLRSLKVLDTVTNYDSTVCINATDGVSVSGANLRFNSLFSALLTDALGASIQVANGVLMGAGAVVDVATVPRDKMTDAFSHLDETSGLNEITRTLDAWKSGKTPDGKPRSIADRGVDLDSSVMCDTKTSLPPAANFRGTYSALARTAGELGNMSSYTVRSTAASAEMFREIPGGSPSVAVTERELIRAQAFAEQLDVQRQAVETVNGSIASELSSSITVRGHQLDLNVKFVNDLSNKTISDYADGAGSK